MSVYTPQEGDLALVQIPNAAPALAQFHLLHDDEPDSGYWSFFGSDWMARAPEAEVVAVVQEIYLVAPEEVTRDGKTQG